MIRPEASPDDRIPAALKQFMIRSTVGDFETLINQFKPSPRELMEIAEALCAAHIYTASGGTFDTAEFPMFAAKTAMRYQNILQVKSFMEAAVSGSA